MFLLVGNFSYVLFLEIVFLMRDRRVFLFLKRLAFLKKRFMNQKILFLVTDIPIFKITITFTIIQYTFYYTLRAR